MLPPVDRPGPVAAALENSTTALAKTARKEKKREKKKTGVLRPSSTRSPRLKSRSNPGRLRQVVSLRGPVASCAPGAAVPGRL